MDYHLEPLTEQETGNYIRHRLQIAGCHASLFTNKACSLVHRLSKGNPRLINQVCDIAMTYGFAEQARVITSKLVAQAALDRSTGGILPLAAKDELAALASAPEDTTEIDAPVPAPTLRPVRLVPTPTVSRSTGSPETFYAEGVALKREGRLKEAIDRFDRASKSPSWQMKALAQAGLCHKTIGDTQAAIQAFHTALNDQSASRKDIIDVQYFLARTFESIGELGEALSVYRRIAQMSPAFKDVAYRVKDLASKPKHLKNGKRAGAGNGSWFGGALEHLQRLIGTH